MTEQLQQEQEQKEQLSPKAELEILEAKISSIEWEARYYTEKLKVLAVVHRDLLSKVEKLSELCNIKQPQNEEDKK